MSQLHILCYHVSDLVFFWGFGATGGLWEAGWGKGRIFETVSKRRVILSV